MRTWTLAWLIFGLAFMSCSAVENGFMAGHNDGVNKAQPDIDNERPSEDGEGIPGYLVDPEFIRFLAEEDDIIITAEKGSFVDSDGRPTEVGVNVISVPLQPNVILNSSSELVVEGKQEKFRRTNPDGSFSTKIPRTDRLVFLQIGRPSNDLKITDQPKNRITVVARSTNDGRTAVVASLDRVRRYLEIIDHDVVDKSPAELNDPNINSDSESNEAIADSSNGAPPTSKLTSMVDCNDAGFYWHHANGTCDERRALAVFPECRKGGINNVESKLDKANYDTEKDLVDDANDDDFDMYQCSFTDETRAVVQLDMSNDKTGEIRTVNAPADAFFD